MQGYAMTTELKQSSRHLPFLESTRRRNATTDVSCTYLSAVAKSVWQLLSGEGVAQYGSEVSDHHLPSLEKLTWVSI